MRSTFREFFFDTAGGGGGAEPDEQNEDGESQQVGHADSDGLGYPVIIPQPATAGDPVLRRHRLCSKIAGF